MTKPASPSGLRAPGVIESVTLSLPISSLDGQHPRENAEVIKALRDALAQLVAEIDS